MHFYEAWFQNFPPGIATLLIAILPIAELRGAIPIGIAGFGLAWWEAFLWAVAGNMIPAILLVWLLEPISKFLSNHVSFFKKFFDWLFERTKKKFYDRHQKFGDLALVLFVGVPLPVTGVWTGSVAAFLFGIPFKRAVPLMLAGVLISATIVTTLTVTVGAFV